MTTYPRHRRRPILDIDDGLHHREPNHPRHIATSESLAQRERRGSANSAVTGGVPPLLVLNLSSPWVASKSPDLAGARILGAGGLGPEDRLRSPRVNHRATYMALLSPPLRDRLLATLEEEGILTLLKAHALRVVDASPVPYVRLEITAGEDGLVAHCTGVWFDVRPLVGPEGEEDYYLPVLGASEGASTPTLSHELLHLHDLLALIEKDPSYPERALNLSVNSVSEPYQIGESIDFEMFKIFAMEPQAYRLEYEMGETWIDAPYFGQPVRYHCATAEELVTLRLADYVATLEHRYVNKFPGNEATIQEAGRRSANHHGREVFGAQAYERIQQVNAQTPWKILAQISRRRSGVTGAKPGG